MSLARLAAGLCAVMGVVGSAPTAYAAKIDSLTMANGDHLTCEIKELERGRLRVKTDDMGTIQVEWDGVAKLSSPRSFEITTEAGHRVYGSLGSPESEGTLRIETLMGPLDLRLLEIVRIIPLGASFWSRLDGALDLGASYTQANSLLQVTPSFSAKYRGRAFASGIDISATWTSQESKDDTSRMVGTLYYTRMFRERAAAFGRATAERNSELGLDLRTLASGGIGYLPAVSNRQRVVLGLGLSANREIPTEGDPTSNLEGLVTAQWQVFTYSYPKTTVDISASIYPGLTDWGRIRGDFDVQLKRELIKDFTASVRLYDSFDNRPATEGASQNDWGAQLAIGWTF